MRLARPSTSQAALGGLLVAAVLALLGLLVAPAAAVAGGAVFVVLGTGLAYDLRGLGARWVEWKRNLGPTLGLSAWLDRTLDGAALAWVGVAVLWAGAGALV
jgi:hypothetical protein